MALNYAETWQPQLLNILIQDSLTSPFITTAVNWMGARVFHFTQMNVGGYKDHSRNGGWNRGTYAQTDVPFTVEHDRDIAFLVDKADVDETNSTASIQNITDTFIRTQQVPETDAYFFSKIAAEAKKANLASETDLSAYTKDNVFEKIKVAIGRKELRRYKQKGGLICYLRTELMDLLERSGELQKKIELTQVSSGGMGIETRVTMIDGVTLMEVIDTDRFMDSYDFADGFNPVGGTTKEINLLVATPMTAMTVPKIASIYAFAPGQHTEGDGWLYQNRSMWDTFVMPNGKNGKVDSVFVDTCATAITA